jgi:hypothetical protein
MQRRTTFPALLALALSLSACQPQRGGPIARPPMPQPPPRYSAAAEVGNGFILLMIFGVICAVAAEE